MSDDQADRKAQTRKQFNTVAADYDAGPGCFAHFGQRLVAVANVGPGQRVLDVASGRGAVLFPSAEQVGRTGEVVGIDLADEMARATNDEAARRGLTARVHVMDAEQLDFRNAAFDCVLCGFGVMFFPNQNLALSEFRRVLKSGGRLGVSTWRVTQNSELDATLDIWDRGTWVPEGSALASLRRGTLKFELKGKRMKGRWALVRMGNATTRKKDLWLLVKRAERNAR